jgi:AraC-like DNA-binding protein
MPGNMDTNPILNKISRLNAGSISTENINSGIIANPDFKITMMLETSDYLNRLEANQFSIFTQKFHKSIFKTLKHFEGSVVKKNDNTYLVIFTSATNAVLCALKIQSDFKYITPKLEGRTRRLHIGISTGIPTFKNHHISVEKATPVFWMCEEVPDQLVITSDVKVLYEKENMNAVIDREHIRTLSPWEELFLTRIMDFSDKSWKTSDFSINGLCDASELSRSQLYRKLKRLTGKSPNAFIREIRLKKALELLHNQLGNISEIARTTGFKSPAYFTKCFTTKFGILPSRYTKQHIY